MTLYFSICFWVALANNYHSSSAQDCYVHRPNDTLYKMQMSILCLASILSIVKSEK